MSLNVNYHLNLQTSDKTHGVDLLRTQEITQTAVSIGGKSYALKGSSEAVKWVKDKMQNLGQSEFRSIREFEAALLQPNQGSAVNKVALDVLGIQVQPDLTAKAKLQRAVSHAFTIGKGMTEIQEKGHKGKLVGEGYYAEVMGDKTQSMTLVNELLQLWKEDKENKLSFPEWSEQKTQAWKASGTDLSVMEWISREAWKKSGTKDSFEVWDLKRIWVRFGSGESSFKKWQKEEHDFRESIRQKETPHLSFNEFNNLFNKRMWADSTMSNKDFEKLELWKKAGSPGDFADWHSEKTWAEEVKAGSKLTFDDWKAERHQSLITRWEGSGLKGAGMSFVDWRTMQDDSLVVVSKNFIRLEPAQRPLFQLSFQLDGQGQTYVQRNGIPYNTEYDKTLHSGKGYAIFVISPQGEFFAGSHIGDVFHHSSFLADGAIIAAGELKTDKEGKIIYLSGKSGHYRPGDEENLQMLRSLKHHGLDLSKSTFSLYTGPGVTKTYPNAEKCLEMLEEMKEKREALFCNPQGLQNFKGQIIINDMGKSYRGEDRLLEVFTHSPAKKAQIQQLDLKIKKTEERVNSLKSIKGIKRQQAKRNHEIESLEMRIKDLKQEIDKINEYIPGKQEACGGGIFNTDDAGKIVEIEAKIGNQIMDKKEILFTLATLQRQRIDISKTNLIHYDSKLRQNVVTNAFEFWKKG